jgi:nucleotide-binding universal stress UspA family protein
MKLLVGVDGSAASLTALRQASALLSPNRDQIILYYSPPNINIPLGSELNPSLVQKWREAIANVVFDAAKAELRPAFADNVTTIIGTQHPRTGLQSAADEVCADGVAVGARGIGPIERLLLGSVSRSIVHSARVPVLVARENNASNHGVAAYRVLVASNEATTDSDLAKALLRFTWPAGAVGHVVTVIEPQFPGEFPLWLKEKTRSPEVEEIAAVFQKAYEADKQSVRERLKAFCQTLAEAFHAEPIIAEGHPAEQILNCLTAERYDLVVIGARALKPIARLFIGSTSEKVLDHAPCSVLLVPRHQHA